MSRYKLFDRKRLKEKSVEERESKSTDSIMINPDSMPPKISELEQKLIGDLAKKIIASRKAGSPVIIAYGAHLFKNGCSPILIRLMESGYVQQLLTNGAGIIHDFEMSLIGRTEEDVRKYMAEGQFGIWDETGKYINLAIKEGAKKNLGLGESVGKCMDEEKIGRKSVMFPYKQYSITWNAYRLAIPLSSCVCIGQDIIHTHPECDGAALGKTSYSDFLIFANSVSGMQNGMFISIGSAVMAPMVLEKALSMAKNAAKAEGKSLDKYAIVVNDIQPGTWDWSRGEPPKDNPAYYLRFCKSFSRMGGDFSYACLDNRAFLHNLYHALKELSVKNR